MTKRIIISPVEVWATPERQFKATLRTEFEGNVKGRTVYGATAEEAEARLLKRLTELEDANEVLTPYATPGEAPTIAEVATVALVVIGMLLFGISLQIAEGAVK